MVSVTPRPCPSCEERGDVSRQDETLTRCETEECDVCLYRTCPGVVRVTQQSEAGLTDPALLRQGERDKETTMNPWDWGVVVTTDGTIIPPGACDGLHNKDEQRDIIRGGSP